MEIELNVLDWAQADLDEMAELIWEARMASPLWVEGQSVDTFKNYIEQSKGRWPDSSLVTAHRDGKLVGWLALITEDPLTSELWRWHPFIKPDEDQELIADQLLQACKEISQEKGAQSLEVCCHLQNQHLTPEVEDYLQIQGSWYEKNGLMLSDETVYMTCTSSEIDLLPEPTFPEPFSICNYHPHLKSTLYEVYLLAFSTGQDRSFLNLTAAGAITQFDRYLGNDLNPQTSAILLRGGQPIGFSLVQTRKGVGDEHMALIAVTPKHQRQGWGRKLLATSMLSAAKEGEKLFSLGVDLVNEPAYQLYSSMGFEVQTKLVTYIWKNES